MQSEVKEEIETPIKETSKPVVFTNKLKDNNNVILNKSLKHLEFINQFEMYLEDKNYKKFPIEFLREFDKIKQDAKLTTLKATQLLNTKHKNAA